MFGWDEREKGASFGVFAELARLQALVWEQGLQSWLQLRVVAPLGIV